MDNLGRAIQYGYRGMTIDLPKAREMYGKALAVARLVAPWDSLIADLQRRFDETSAAQTLFQTRRNKVFISYAHANAEYFERLNVHINGLRNTAAFLVTSDFIASDFAWNKERRTLMDAAAGEGVKVLWLPASPCNWRNTPFAEFQAVKLGANVVPLSIMDYNDREDVYAKVAEEIEKVFERK